MTEKCSYRPEVLESTMRRKLAFKSNAERIGTDGQTVSNLLQVVESHAEEFYQIERDLNESMLSKPGFYFMIARTSILIALSAAIHKRSVEEVVDEKIDQVFNNRLKKYIPAIRDVFDLEKSKYTEEEWTKIETVLDYVLPRPKKGKN